MPLEKDGLYTLVEDEKRAAQLCGDSAPDDGMLFDPESVRAEPMTVDAERTRPPGTPASGTSQPEP